MKYCQHVVMTTFQYQSTVMRRISLKPANSKFIVKENIYVYFDSLCLWWAYLRRTVCHKHVCLSSTTDNLIVEDPICCGRPCTARIGENVKTFEAIVWNIGRTSLKRIEKIVYMCKESVGKTCINIRTWLTENAFKTSSFITQSTVKRILVT